MHFVLLPSDADEEYLEKCLPRIMRAQRFGWDYVVFAVRGDVFEWFDAMDVLFNTCIWQNAKVPILLF